VITHCPPLNHNPTEYERYKKTENISISNGITQILMEQKWTLYGETLNHSSQHFYYFIEHEKIKIL
jgi:hypothetical protein